MNENEITIPETIQLIPTPMPPQLPKLVRHRGDRRYFAVYYEGTHATWSDGRAGATFSFFHVYQPLTEHPAVALYLWGRDLGSDDGPPRDALLVDRAKARLLVGSAGDVRSVLDSQHPPRPDRRLTPEEFDATVKAMNEEMQQIADTGSWAEVGMFEWMTRPSPELEIGCREMLSFLDTHVTEEVVERFIALYDGGDLRALGHLRYLKKRIDAMCASLDGGASGRNH